MKAKTLFFQCNICGQSNVIELSTLQRETASCLSCGSSARQRSVIRALTEVLFGESKVLTDLPPRYDIIGLGLTDSDVYATRLREKFTYTNTFYHCEPRLDISAADVCSPFYDTEDFVISSEVFEHVVPPVDRAFSNCWRILKPGGTLIMTVPYSVQLQTIEHFPKLYRYHVHERNGAFVLQNTTATGEAQEFGDLVFHGGPGNTLEMRIFSERDLISHLERAGFTDITVYRKPDFAHGIWWPEKWSLPISARKGRS